jgi:hypothetical protein
LHNLAYYSAKITKFPGTDARNRQNFLSAYSKIKCAKNAQKTSRLKIYIKKIAQKLAHSKKTPYLCIAFKIKHDSLAQLVEHNTFNVGVLGSSPRRITNKTSQVIEFQLLGLFLSPKLSSFCPPTPN